MQTSHREQVGGAVPSVVMDANKVVQDVWNQPECVESIMSQFDADLRDRFGLMSQNQPAKADYMRMRVQRGVLLAVRERLTHRELSRAVAPLLSDGASLADRDLPEEPEYYITKATPQLSGDGDTFLRAGLVWLNEASVRVDEEIESSPNHPYQGFSKLFGDVFNRYVAAYEAYTQTTIEPRTLNEHLRLGRRENMDATLATLLRAGWAHQQIDPSAVTPIERVRFAAAHLDRLSWPASTTKEHFKKSALGTLPVLFDGNQRDPRPDHPFNITCRTISDSSGSFIGYSHPSLRAGPWRSRRFCAGLHAIDEQVPANPQRRILLLNA